MREYRLGLIVPAANSTFEPDFALAFSPRVTLHSHRVWAPGHRFESEAMMDDVNARVPDAARALAQAGVHGVSYGFTTASFYRGVKYAHDLQAAIATAANVLSVVPAVALIEALNHFEAKKISITTPYPEWNNSALRRFMAETKLEILSFQGDDRPKEIAEHSYMWDQSPDEIVKFVVQHCHTSADLMMCPCTAWRALEVVETLEDKLGIPVITANQATIWSISRKLRIEHEVRNLGSLLKM